MAANGRTAVARRPELDVLTVLTVAAVGVLHTVSIFSGYQLVTNKGQSQLATILASLVVSSEFIWVMPVMMLVAGMALWYSLQRRTAGQVVRERLLRLGLPLLTGLVIANPPQIYYFLRSIEGLQESFWRFYPRYWNIRFSLGSFPYFLEPVGGGQTFSLIHLWFLMFLLIYTLLLLPLLVYLRGASGARVAERVAGFLARRYAVFLWAIPIALLEALAGAIWPSGWSRWIWPLIILFGYLAAGSERLSAALARHAVAGLVWGTLLYLIYFAGMGALASMQVDPWTDPGGPAMLHRVIKVLASWFLVVGVVGLTLRLGQRAARRASAQAGEPARPGFGARALAYAREAQLPYYVLHQTPIIIIGYYVVQWNMGILPKFLIISLPSMAIVLLVYELLIRRIGVLRFLFGMKPRPAPAPSPAQREPGAG